MTLAMSKTRCAVCYLLLAQYLVDEGYGCHPTCDPREQPTERNVV